MPKTLFVKEIILILKDPRICPSCEKADKLQENIIFENNSKGKTFLCIRCEALIVVTHLNLKQVKLLSKTNDNIMLKEPYNIRKVSY